MKLSKKILTSALSSAMAFQFMPAVEAIEDIPKITITRPGETDSKTLKVYDSRSFRLKVKEMLKITDDCVWFINNVDVDDDFAEEMMGHLFSSIVNAFDNVFYGVLKPILEDEDENYGSKPLKLERDIFVPTFLVNSHMSLEDKATHLSQFGKCLEYRLRINKKISRLIDEYAKIHPEFSTIAAEYADRGAEIIKSAHRGLIGMLAKGGEDVQNDLFCFPPVNRKNTAKDDSLSNSESDCSDSIDNGTSGSKEEVKTKTDIQDNPEENADKVSEEIAVHEEENDSEDQSETKENSESDKKSANLMVRFLRFISGGLLFKEK